MESKLHEAEPTDQWSTLIEKIRADLQSKKSILLLLHVLNCVDCLLHKQVDYSNQNFWDEIFVLLEACKFLDEEAHEKQFTEELGNLVLTPLVKILKQRDSSLLRKAEEFIRADLSFGKYGNVKHNTLCDHNQSLLANHRSLISFFQNDFERYDEAAMIIQVIDYWRHLKTRYPGAFSALVAEPAFDLLSDMASKIKSTCSPIKKKIYVQMFLLLQLLFINHPSMKDINWEQLLSAQVIKSSLLKDFKQDLAVSRQCFLHSGSTALSSQTISYTSESLQYFQSLNVDILQAQFTHSQGVIDLIRTMFKTVTSLLGVAPCDIALCVLGSTSRFDRRPYSDLEIMLLHSELDSALDQRQFKKMQKQIEFYIHYLISLLELIIVRLGETQDLDVEGGNAGLHFDSTCHLWDKKTWGTPEELINRFIISASIDEGNQMHPWLDSESLYALLNPLMIATNTASAKELIAQYKTRVNDYLNSKVLEKDKVTIILTRFQHTHLWYQQLTRRQGIALTCWHDVLNKSIESYDLIAEGHVVDIKKTFYKPLVYSALNFRLYFGWETQTPQSIIDYYTAKLPWGGQVIRAWWSVALAYVAQYQVDLHMKCKHQEEHVKYSLHLDEDKNSLQLDKDKMFWASMALIMDGFIKPLAASLNLFFSGKLHDIEEVGYHVLVSYLNARKNWLRGSIKRFGLNESLLSHHPLIEPLKHFPAKNGWSPLMHQNLNQHLLRVKSLSLSEASHCTIAGCPLFDPRGSFFPLELVQQCINDKGEFIGDPRYSSQQTQAYSEQRSHVRELHWNEQQWFIKVKAGNKEGLMGREFMAMMLHLLLGGHPQVALGWPLKLSYAHHGKARSYYAWLSEKIEGVSLSTVMLEHPEWLTRDRVDIESFSQLFLFTFLTCPEDGQPENFKVLRVNGKTRFIAIDYGQCFVVADRKEKQSFFSSEVSVLTIKTMMYLLDSMEERLSDELITRIRLLDVNAWYAQWKSSFDGLNTLFKPLLEEDLAPNISKADWGKYNRIVDVPEGVLFCIKTRLELVQRWMRTTDKPITGNNLLASLEPLVASQYASLKAKIKTPEDFYQKIDVKAYVKDPKSGKMVSSATFASIQQHTLTPQQLVISSNLDPGYFRRIDFRMLNEEQQEFHLRLLEIVAEKMGNKFIRLNLRGCRIEESRLFKILERMVNLQVLDLRDCLKIKMVTIVMLLAHRPNATFLTYNYDVLCPKLQAIKFIVNKKNEVLTLHLSVLERQMLTKEARYFMQKVEYAIQILNNLSSKSVWSEARSALSVLEKLGNLFLDEVADEVVIKLIPTDNNPIANEDSKHMTTQGEQLSEELDKGMKLFLDSNTPLDVRLYCLVFIDSTHKRVIEICREALNHTDVQFRNIAAVALTESGIADDLVINVLLEALNDSNHYVRQSAATALGRLDNVEDQVIEALGKAKSDPVLDVSQSATVAYERLYKSKMPDLQNDALVTMFSDSPISDPERQMAGEAIVQLGKSKVLEVEALLEGLKGPDLFRHQADVKSLAHLEKAEEQVIDALVKILEDRKAVAHIPIANALCKELGKAGERMIELLLQMLKSSNQYARCFAADVLGKCQGDVFEKFGFAHERVIYKLSEEINHHIVLMRNLCESVAKVLKQSPNAQIQVIDALLKTLQDSIKEVRQSAAEALGYLGYVNDRIIDGLLNAMKDLEEDVSDSAVNALGSIGLPEDRIIDALVKMMISAKKKSSLIDALGSLFAPEKCWKNIQQRVRRLSTETPSQLNNSNYDKITKRIFFFVDNESSRALPQVCRKWKELYADFRENQQKNYMPEMRLQFKGMEEDKQQQSNSYAQVDIEFSMFK